MSDALAPVALTIAGSDCSGGAGIQADLKTFNTLEVYGATVITALTAQNTCGVRGVVPVDAQFVGDQIDAVFDDMRVTGVKLGMLHDAGIVDVVAARLAARSVKNLVVDPVMVSTSGHNLLASNGVDRMISQIFPMALLLTPNMPEAEFLTGRAITDTSSMVETAKIIADMGPEAVIIKGGHGQGAKVIDLLYHNGETKIFERDRIDTPHTHGSGCTFSAAITACLAKAETLEAAVQQAEKFIDRAIRNAYPIGKGISPVNHLA